ncbi:hypothetical protein F5X96DRAFT_534029 [Biscogniauxia mediterranea]|nr:hypothetical protein F5X96DRAFT_534029 [Biscogniauxia mediterranea]
MCLCIMYNFVPVSTALLSIYLYLLVRLKSYFSFPFSFIPGIGVRVSLILLIKLIDPLSRILILFISAISLHSYYTPTCLFSQFRVFSLRSCWSKAATDLHPSPPHPPPPQWLTSLSPD